MSDLLTWFGDDFTGSGDVLLRYTQAGVPALLFLRPPSPAELAAAAKEHAAVGIAGITRALPTDQIGPPVRAAFESLAALRPRVVQYKICSTADSGVDVGSIGPAVEIGRELFGARPVAILPAQPDLGRYTAFANHFGRDGTGVHRLDRLPAMANHPSTPMREADLRRHFKEQLGADIANLPITVLRAGGADDAIRRMVQDQVIAFVVDALDNDDLRRAADALLGAGGDPLFAVGSGGLSTGLALASGFRTSAGGDRRSGEPPSSCLVVSGSAAGRTTEQIDHAAAAGWTVLPLDPAGLSERAVQDVAGRAAAALADAPGVVVFTAHHRLLPPAGRVDAAAVGAALGEVVRSVRAAARPPRVVVAGGDTSGFVLTALGAATLSAAGTVGEYLLLGVVGAEDESVDGLEVVLKGGQLGGVDIFEQALRQPALT